MEGADTGGAEEDLAETDMTRVRDRELTACRGFLCKIISYILPHIPY